MTARRRFIDLPNLVPDRFQRGATSWKATSGLGRHSTRSKEAAHRRPVCDDAVCYGWGSYHDPRRGICMRDLSLIHCDVQVDRACSSSVPQRRRNPMRLRGETTLPRSSRASFVKSAGILPPLWPGSSGNFEQHGYAKLVICSITDRTLYERVDLRKHSTRKGEVTLHICVCGVFIVVGNSVKQLDTMSARPRWAARPFKQRDVSHRLLFVKGSGEPAIIAYMSTPVLPLHTYVSQS